MKDKFWRITTRHGGQKAPAIIAVAHFLLILVYRVLLTGQPYPDREAVAVSEPQRQRQRSSHHRVLDRKRNNDSGPISAVLECAHQCMQSEN